MAETYERQIASAQGRGDRPEADRIRLEYEGFLESWRAQAELARSFPLETDSEWRSLRGETERLRATELLRKAEGLQYSSPRDCLLRAKLHDLLGHGEDALRAYDALIDLVPDDPRLHHGRGRCLLRLERWESAQRAFGRVLDVDPDHASALRGRGIALLRLGRAEESLVLLQRSMIKSAAAADTHFHIGEALILLARPEEAVVAYERALRWAPQEHRYVHSLVRTYLCLGRVKAAVATLDRAFGYETSESRAAIERLLLDHVRDRPRPAEVEEEDDGDPAPPRRRHRRPRHSRHSGRDRWWTPVRRLKWFLGLSLALVSSLNFFTGKTFADPPYVPAAEVPRPGAPAPRLEAAKSTTGLVRSVLNAPDRTEGLDRRAPR